MSIVFSIEKCVQDKFVEESDLTLGTMESVHEVDLSENAALDSEVLHTPWGPIPPSLTLSFSSGLLTTKGLVFRKKKKKPNSKAHGSITITVQHRQTLYNSYMKDQMLPWKYSKELIKKITHSPYPRLGSSYYPYSSLGVLQEE